MVILPTKNLKVWLVEEVGFVGFCWSVDFFSWLVGW